MTKRDWVFTLLPLFATWGVDRITKLMALTIQGIEFYGPVGLVLHFNRGAMLGLFSDLPPLLRIVSLSTGGAFLLVAYAIIQFLLPIKSLTLRVGLSLLMGGILGNVADRIAWGYVVDFLILGTISTHTPAFNIADAVQWAGYGMIVWALVKEGEILWPSGNIRKQYWVNMRYQLKYCFTLMGVGLAFSVIAGIYSYTFLRVVIIDLVGENKRILGQFLTPYLFTFVLVSLGFSAILFLLGRILSHRTAGPLYAFERYLQDIISGKVRPLKLRSHDEFKHLEDLALELSTKLQPHMTAEDAQEPPPDEKGTERKKA